MIAARHMTLLSSNPVPDDATAKRDQAIDEARRDTRQVVEDAARVNRTLLAKLEELSEVLREQIDYPTAPLDEGSDP